MALSVPVFNNAGQNNTPIYGFDPGSGNTSATQQSGQQINAPWNGDQYQQAVDWANNYVGQNNIDPSWGNSSDLVRAWEGQVQGGQAPGDAAQNAAVNYLGWGQQPQAAAPASGGGGGAGGGGGGQSNGQGLFNPSYYTGFSGQAPGDFSSYLNQYQMPTLPQFKGPPIPQAPAFSYADFKAPTLDEAKGQPGYQFGVNEGLQALQQSAASKGLLRTGGTLKDIQQYGQNAATQNYGNVLNQDLGIYNTNRAGAVQQYNTNYQTQYSDPYKAQFAEAQAEYAPQLLQYQQQAQNAEQNAQFGYNSDWAKYLNQQDVYYNNQNSPFSKYLSLAQLGAANA